MTRLREIAGRAAKASRGPWRVVKAGEGVFRGPHLGAAEDNCIVGPDGQEIMGSSEWLRVSDEDLDFMAHAREDVSELLAMLNTGAGQEVVVAHDDEQLDVLMGICLMQEHYNAAFFRIVLLMEQEIARYRAAVAEAMRGNASTPSNQKEGP